VAGVDITHLMERSSQLGGIKLHQSTRKQTATHTNPTPIPTPTIQTIINFTHNPPANVSSPLGLVDRTKLLIDHNFHVSPTLDRLVPQAGGEHTLPATLSHFLDSSVPARRAASADLLSLPGLIGPREKSSFRLPSLTSGLIGPREQS
jgi:hypothetical protein